MMKTLKLLILFIALSAHANTADDQEIINNLEFFSQMEYLENEEDYELIALLNEEGERSPDEELTKSLKELPTGD
jgi:thioredoxin-related protein